MSKKRKTNTPASHDLRLSARNDMTVGELKTQLASLCVPGNAIIWAANGKDWRKIVNLSFCRETNELSLLVR